MESVETDTMIAAILNYDPSYQEDIGHMDLEEIEALYHELCQM